MNAVSRMGARTCLVAPALLALASACSDASSKANAPAACAPFDAIVAMSDYSSSAVGACAAGGATRAFFGVDLGSDPVLARSAGRVFLIARDQDRLIELDPACGTPIAKINVHDDAAAGATNPQDVAVAADGTLWIPRYNVPSVLVADEGGAKLATIDLAPYDPDGNPNASALRIVSVGGAAKAFVTLERLDDTTSPPKPRGSATVLRIDVATRTVEAAIDLVGENPFGVTDDGAALWLAEPGDFGAIGEPRAGIERFDPQAGASRLVVGEAALGGSVAQVAVTAGCGAAIVADPSAKNRTALVTFDPESGVALTSAASAVVGPTDDFDLEGLAFRGGALFVGDRRRAAAGYPVHVFDVGDGCILHARPDTIFVPQKPVALVPVAAP